MERLGVSLDPEILLMVSLLASMSFPLLSPHNQIHLDYK